MSEVLLKLLRPVHGGYCLAHRDGQTYMVRFGLPGEQVKAVPVAKKGKVIFAEVSEVLQASEQRQVPVWALGGPAGTGGADLCHVKLAFQRTWKAQVLADCLRRLGGEDVYAQALTASGGELRCEGVNAAHAGTGHRCRDSATGATCGEGTDNASSDDGLGYRLRADFEISTAKHLAMTKFRGEELVEITSFPLADPMISDSSLFSNPDSWSKVLKPGGRIRTWASADGLRVWNGHALFDESAHPVAERNVRLTVPGFGDYLVAPSGFWQAHRQAAQVLCEQVIAAATSARVMNRDALSPSGKGVRNGGSGEFVDSNEASGSIKTIGSNDRLLIPGNRRWEEILELYSGAGLFSRPLAKILDRGGRLSTLEGSKPAVKMARKNLSGAPGHLQIHAGRVDARALADYADKMKAPPLVVMDPPRSGAGQKVMAALASLEPERIIYVACDPAALARDLKVAVSHGYQIASLQAYDLFPHTHHVECVVLMSKVD
ncbi:class I SAM-dependent RNA methyltransferase [Varibaculum vaginae]|uniref:class I SAM-dependent RNA methyltransferase n=1 Tax=Varibaculum vaginae TaxID=2364797 RepID=UPI000F084904|nr:class I SAM-dependent RNA methyltransferase [Varibaculum vaginae]